MGSEICICLISSVWKVIQCNVPCRMVVYYTNSYVLTNCVAVQSGGARKYPTTRPKMQKCVSVNYPQLAQAVRASEISHVWFTAQSPYLSTATTTLWELVSPMDSWMQAICLRSTFPPTGDQMTSQADESRVIKSPWYQTSSTPPLCEGWEREAGLLHQRGGGKFTRSELSLW